MALIGISLVILSVTYVLCWRRPSVWPRITSFFVNRKTQAHEPPSIATSNEVLDESTAPNAMNGLTYMPIADVSTSSSQCEPVGTAPSPPQGKDVTTHSSSKLSPSELMPPPPRPGPKSMANSSVQRAFLQPQGRGPLPNRGPANAGGATSLLSPLTYSTQPPSKSRKIILAPGHSPLDWAALTNSGSNLAGVPFPQRITRAQLAQQTGRKGKPAWAAWQGKVYNIGPYLPFHPGGAGELLRAAGKMPEVSEKLFAEVHPWVNWEGMMAACLVGFLVGEADEEKTSTLEAVD